MNDKVTQESVRYEPEENPPHALSLGLGLQMAGISVAGIIITPVIVIKAAGIEGPYLNWAVFAALVISGITTMVQAVKVGRIGAGHVLLMGTSGAFISVCVAALAEGGPGLMAMLILVSALVQFLFRREALTASPNSDSSCCRYRDHAHSGNRAPDRLRHVDPGCRGCSLDGRRRSARALRSYLAQVSPCGRMERSGFGHP